MLTKLEVAVANILGVGEAKKRFSELMSRVAYKRERFLIERHGKPMVAVVSAEDLERLEREPVAPKGLLAAVGAWAEYKDLDSSTVVNGEAKTVTGVQARFLRIRVNSVTVGSGAGFTAKILV